MLTDYINILNVYGHMLLAGAWPNGPIGGLALTVIMAVIGMIVSFPLAIAVGVGRLSHIKVIARVCWAYVMLVRSIPLILLIFWAYFVVPLLIGDAVSGRVTVVVALVVYETTYIAEIIRSAIQALPRGQAEAARSLGMGYFRTLWEVILPQALFNAIPSILNQFIALLKDTSLAYIISVGELTYSAYEVNSQLLTKPVQVYLLLAAIYFLLCFSLGQAVRGVERTIRKRRQNTKSARTA